ncbi:hypothetical protein F4778DRAFT_775883 [Xylariomycetidae sp. FL2044]|nr:hypothetical protein F4778DRAFT_775883 [Xylariomycetidae sp. FL2044]
MADFESTGPLMASAMWPITFFCALFLGLRLYIKIDFGSRWWWDDYVLLFSWICLLIQTSLVQKAISMGFGMHLTDVIATQPQNIVYIALYGAIGLNFAVLSINLSRVSFAITLLKLTNGWWKRFVWFSIVSLVVLAIPAIVLSWTSCVPFAKSFDDAIPGRCISKQISLVYGIIEAAYSAALDFALALLPWKIIGGLQMLRAEKIGVCVAMSLGVFSGIITIARAVYIVQLGGEDFSYDGKDVTIWSATEPASAIIAASIPILRVFVNKKTSSYKNSNRQGYKRNPTNDITLEPITHRSAVARGQGTKTWVTSNGDDESDKSILHEDRAAEIICTSSFTVEFPDDVHSGGSRQISAATKV